MMYARLREVCNVFLFLVVKNVENDAKEIPMNRCTKPMKRMIIKFDERASCYVKMGGVVENLKTGRKSCNDISDIELILREK